MGSLSNLYISQSYQSLIHLGTNEAATSTPTELEDGLGNGIGVSVSTDGNLYVSGNIYAANLTGSGGTINTGSFATTGSNTFTGPNNFSSSIDVIGGINMYQNGLFMGYPKNMGDPYDNNVGIFTPFVYGRGGQRLFLSGDVMAQTGVSINNGLTVTGSLYVAPRPGMTPIPSNITASGNISASGNIYAANLTGSTVDTSSLVTTASFNAYTQSTNVFTASISTSVGLLQTFSGSQYKNDSSSFDNRINAITASGVIPTGTVSSSAQIIELGFATTSSVNTLSQSVDSRLDSLETAGYVTATITGSSLVTASVSQSTITFTKGDGSQFNIVVADISGSTFDTGSLVTTASFNQYTQSTDNRLNSIESFTASVSTSVGLLQTFSSSQYKSDSSSFDSRIDSLEIASGGFVTTASFNSFSTSVDSRLDSIEFLDTTFATTASVNTLSASIYQTDATQSSLIDGKLDTSSFSTFSTSVDSRLDLLELSGSGFATTASVNALSASIYQTDATQSNDILVLSASNAFDHSRFATTGSNTFNGNQTINGDISSSGTLTVNVITASAAQITYLHTLYETSSVIYSSGSNQFGDELTDVQILSGSVQIVGGLTINGVSVSTQSVDINSLNAFTASQIVSNSYFATTGSNTFNGNQNITGSLTASGLKYPSVDNGEKSFIQTDGNGNLSLQYVDTIFEAFYAGESVPKGTPLYLSGSVGANPIARAADASDPNKMPVTLIANENLTATNTYEGIVLGLIEGINLTGFTAGQTVYVAEGGGYSTSLPSGSNSITQVLGVITKGGSGGKGLVLNPGPAQLPGLREGYVWVGNNLNQPTAVATSSFIEDLSGYTTTASFNAYTASQDFKNTTFATTSSVNDLSASIFSTDSTQSNNINSLTSKTGSYATTGSNTFTGLNTFNEEVRVLNNKIIRFTNDGTIGGDSGSRLSLDAYTGMQFRNFSNNDMLFEQFGTASLNFYNYNSGIALTGSSTTIQGVNFIPFSSSLNSRILAATINTGSFAITGSNTFVGNQTITGSITTTQDITVSGVKFGFGNPTGTSSIAIGNSSTLQNNTGQSNVAIGVNALNLNVTGNNSVAIGTNALQNALANNNTGIGADTLKNAKANSDSNTAIGQGALENHFDGDTHSGDNMAFGLAAMQNVTSGSANTAIGTAALRDAGRANENVFIGWISGINASGSVDQNVVIGGRAGQKLAGSSNTIIGHNAGSELVNGGANTFIGQGAGSGIVTGSSNTLIGRSLVGVNNWNNVIAISDGAGAIKTKFQSNIWEFTGSVDISGSLTASLQQGYVWVGDTNGRTITVATSSFGGGTINTGSFATTGSNNFVGNQTINGALQISSSATYDLDITGGFQATAASRVSSSAGVANISPNIVGYTSNTSSILSNLVKGAVVSTDSTGTPTTFRTIQISANPSVIGPVSLSGVTVPSIVIASGSTAGGFIAPIQFQHVGNYTDGRVTVTTPLSASAGITSSDAFINGALYSATSASFNSRILAITGSGGTGSVVGVLTTGSVGTYQTVLGGLNADFRYTASVVGGDSGSGGSNILALSYDIFNNVEFGYWIDRNFPSVLVNGPGVTNASISSFNFSSNLELTLSSGTVTAGGNYTFTGPYFLDLKVTGSVHSNFKVQVTPDNNNVYTIDSQGFTGYDYTNNVGGQLQPGRLEVIQFNGNNFGMVSTGSISPAGLDINYQGPFLYTAYNGSNRPMIGFQSQDQWSDGRITVLRPLVSSEPVIISNDVTASKILVTDSGNSAIQYNQQSTGSVAGVFNTSYGKDNLKVYQYQGQPYAFNVNLTANQINAYTGSEFQWGLQVNGNNVSLPGGGGTYFSMASGSNTGSAGDPGTDKLGLNYLGTSMILDMFADTAFRRKVYVDKGMYVSQSVGGGIPPLIVNGSNAASSKAVEITGSVDIDGTTTLRNVIQLADFATLSTGSTGQLAMSGSQLYFYTGGTWRQVSLV
jgi:hypothetical protein